MRLLLFGGKGGAEKRVWRPLRGWSYPTCATELW